MSDNKETKQARAVEAGARDERAAFDVALDALAEYQRNWDTGLPAEYASTERIAMECAVEAVREALNEARAALARASEIKTPDVILTGAQLLEALDFIAPDRVTDPEQLESEVAIQYGTGHSGKAYYVWCAEYPEEGSLALDGSSARASEAAAGEPVDGIYVASRASIPDRPDMWKGLRMAGWPIVSTWIDESGEGETGDFAELWVRIEREIRRSIGVLLYAETDDFPLKGALIECGLALGMGKPIAIVLPNVALHPRSMKPIGSWVKHPLVTIYPTLAEARDALIAAPQPAQAAGDASQSIEAWREKFFSEQRARIEAESLLDQSIDDSPNAAPQPASEQQAARGLSDGPPGLWCCIMETLTSQGITWDANGWVFKCDDDLYNFVLSILAAKGDGNA